MVNSRDMTKVLESSMQRFHLRTRLFGFKMFLQIVIASIVYLSLNLPRPTGLYAWISSAVETSVV